MSIVFKHKNGALGLHLLIQPGAKKSVIIGPHDQSLKIKIAAPPVDGKANAEVISFMAKFLGVKKSEIEIVKGQTSKLKTLCIRGLSEIELSEKLSLK